MTDSEGRRRALLVGVDRYSYLDPRHQLDGAVADATAMAAHLESVWGFPRQDMAILTDGDATCEAIVEAMEDLVAAAGEDDAVLLHFSGHGTWRKDPEGSTARSDAREKVFIPHDGGNCAPHAGRNLGGDYFAEVLGRLTAVTPNVTLVFDCCHSGTITREADAPKVRQVPPVGGAPRAPLAPADGWTGTGPRPYTLVAACHSDQVANELLIADDPPAYRGALTHHLLRQLEVAARRSPTPTWREVMDGVTLEVMKVYPRQVPQLEGERDRKLFDLEEGGWTRFVPVEERRPDGRVVLAGGTVQRVEPGSRWSVYPGGFQDGGEPPAKASAGDRALGRLRVVSAGPSKAEAEVVEEVRPGAVDRSCRAVLTEPGREDLRLPVSVEAPAGHEDEAERLRRAIAESPLLRSPAGAVADVVARLLPAREEAADPLPDLGPLSEPVWAVVGGDRRPIMPLRRLRHGTVNALVSNLEKRACHRQLLRLRNPDLDDPLHDAVTFTLWRETAGGDWQEVEESDPTPWRLGERFGFELHNAHGDKVYPYVLDLGFGGGVCQLFPLEGSRAPLTSGHTVECGLDDERGSCFRFRAPEGYPYLPADRERRELEVLKVIVSAEPLDLQLFLQDSYRHQPAAFERAAGGELGRRLAWITLGHRWRTAHEGEPVAEHAWTTLERRVHLAP